MDRRLRTFSIPLVAAVALAIGATCPRDLRAQSVHSPDHLGFDHTDCDCAGCQAYRAHLEHNVSFDDGVASHVNCNCPGCLAYRAELEHGVFITDSLASPWAQQGVVQTQGEIVQPEDVELDLGNLQQQYDTSTAAAAASSDMFSAAPGFENIFAPTPAASTEFASVLNTAPAATSVSASTASYIAAPETGSILRDAGPTNAVTLQRRNTVSYDPHVRGFRYGQVLSRVGGVWSPVRQDLDSPISKLDPSLIENMAVIPGPYAAQYGPAFSYLDIETVATPRYQNGYESHARIGETYHENRGRQHGRATVYGGGSDWGFIGHYGSRTGSDYRSGNNTLIPSSYNNQSFLGQLGFDLTDHSKVEVRYDRLDQNDTEYALQFFDINYLGSDSTSIRYVDVDPAGPFSQVNFDAWYNRTRYNGDNQNPSKQAVVDRVRVALIADLPGTAFNPDDTAPDTVEFIGRTFGNRMLTGGRLMGTLGEQGDVQSRVGVDYRYEDQAITENFWINDYANSDQVAFNTNLPKCWLDDVGVFDELVLPVNSYWTTTLGARCDIMSTDVRAGDIRTGGNIDPADVSQADTLYSFYWVNDVLLTSNWSTRFGFGHAQRLPTLVERYSDGVFLGIIQSGFSRVIGDPNLDKERLWQADWAVDCNYENVRARGALFNSWVLDFSTYSGNIISSPDGARLLTAVNTDLATLAGCEFYGEADMTENITLFSALNYVQGTDQTIDRPMWGISPLVGRTGIRLHDSDGGRTWGSELGVRLVDRQNRAAWIRNTGVPDVFVPIEQVTPGFGVCDLRNYYNLTPNTSLILGVENLFDKNYIEHLDLRLPGQSGALVPGQTSALPAEYAFSPGITFYTGIEIVN